MTEVFDLDAFEVEGEPFRFRHGGQDYELPPDIDLTTVRVLDSGDVERVFERLLGEDVWKAISEGETRFGVKKLLALLDAYTKHLGVESLGGSSASAASS